MRQVDKKNESEVERLNRLYNEIMLEQEPELEEEVLLVTVWVLVEFRGTKLPMILLWTSCP